MTKISDNKYELITETGLRILADVNRDDGYVDVAFEANGRDQVVISAREVDDGSLVWDWFEDVAAVGMSDERAADWAVTANIGRHDAEEAWNEAVAEGVELDLVRSDLEDVLRRGFAAAEVVAWGGDGDDLFFALTD